MKKLLITLFLLGIVHLVQAQSRCGNTIQNHENRMHNSPRYRNRILDYQKKLAIKLALRSPTCTNGPIIIPVAVHYDAGIVPASQEACVITLIQDQISSLNKEFNGNDPQNTAYEPLQNCFPGSPEIGNSCIEFCLASYNHPPGYGLNEGDVAVTFGKIDFSILNPGSTAVPKDPNWAGYLNIFVDDLSGTLLGESAGIPGDFSGEGVIIDDCTFGTGEINCANVNSSASCGGIYNEGNTLTHEIGHYIGLYHIWGDNSNCVGTQDEIDDTPGMVDGYGGFTSCANDNQCSALHQECNTPDMYMNYMSYAGDICLYMFTSDQADVMNNTVQLAGFSTNSPQQCTAPVLPVANFSWVPSPIEICDGTTIQFTDESTGPPKSWNWTFSGAGVTPTSSTLQNPIVTPSSTGTLTATLTATNSVGSSNPNSQDITVTILAPNNPICTACEYSLDLMDSFGDGWEGAELNVLVAGTSVGTFTLSNGSSGTFTFSTQTNQEIELVFAGGDTDSEITFDLKDPFGNVIYHQSEDPADGTLYTTAANCNQPTCDDGLQNANETDVDCGGPDCPACPICGSKFYDSGGSSNNYSTNEDITWTLCPDNAGDVVTVTFTQFDLEDHASCNYDDLSVYDGSGNNSLIGKYCGATIPGPFTSTKADGCLTFVFHSDGSNEGSGWEADITCANPLPIELVDFYGYPKENANLLFWTTATEQNTAYHELQRSLKGNLFETIGIVGATGHSNQIKDYHFLDKNPHRLSYYRLITVDLDGSNQFSDVISVERDLELGIISVLPIPTNEKVVITYNTKEPKEMTFTITDIVGKTLKVISYQSYAGNNTTELDLSQFASGVYFVVISDGVQRVTERLLRE